MAFNHHLRQQPTHYWEATADKNNPSASAATTNVYRDGAQHVIDNHRAIYGSQIIIFEHLPPGYDSHVTITNNNKNGSQTIIIYRQWDCALQVTINNFQPIHGPQNVINNDRSVLGMQLIINNHQKTDGAQAVVCPHADRDCQQPPLPKLGDRNMTVPHHEKGNNDDTSNTALQDATPTRSAAPMPQFDSDATIIAPRFRAINAPSSDDDWAVETQLVTRDQTEQGREAGSPEPSPLTTSPSKYSEESNDGTDAETPSSSGNTTPPTGTSSFLQKHQGCTVISVSPQKMHAILKPYMRPHGPRQRRIEDYADAKPSQREELYRKAYGRMTETRAKVGKGTEIKFVPSSVPWNL